MIDFLCVSYNGLVSVSHDEHMSTYNTEHLKFPKIVVQRNLANRGT